MLPDTVGDPLAVVVHPKDTPAALPTVMSAWWLDTLADLAIVHEFELQVVNLVFGNLHTRHKGLILWLFQSSLLSMSVAFTCDLDFQRVSRSFTAIRKI